MKIRTLLYFVLFLFLQQSAFADSGTDVLPNGKNSSELNVFDGKLPNIISNVAELPYYLANPENSSVGTVAHGYVPIGLDMLDADPCFGASTANGGSSPYINCGGASEDVLLSVETTGMPADLVVGWWITEENSVTLASYGADAANVDNTTPGIVNHVFNMGGTCAPVSDYTLPFDCSALDKDKSYYATPVVLGTECTVTDDGILHDESVTYAGIPANGRYTTILGSDITCAPAVDGCDPVYTVTVEISGYPEPWPTPAPPFPITVVGFGPNTSNYAYKIISGNGTWTLTSTQLSPLYDPADGSLKVGTATTYPNASDNVNISATMEITYPGALPPSTYMTDCLLGPSVKLRCEVEKPTLTITNNTCSPVVAGTIEGKLPEGYSATDYELQWSTDGGTTWSATAPTYTTSVINVSVKCVNKTTGCESEVKTEDTNPTDCSAGGSSLLVFNNCSTPVSTSFDGFAGSGFSPTPTSGQLNSENWAITGFSDGAMDFGGTATTGDFSRGNTDGTGEGDGGIYSYNSGALYIQPAGSDFTPGSITLRIQNNTGNDIYGFDIAYDLLVLNDQGRSNSFNFSYSTDDATYTDVASLDYTSGETADATPAVITENKSATVTGITVANGNYIYFRWTGDDVSGGGSRDEFGLDNISITPECCPTFTGAPDNVTVVNSTCQSDCTEGGGSIAAPTGTPCPAGSKIEYSVNGGMSWSTDVPSYNQTTPMNIQTRCKCNADDVTSPASAVLTTVPGTCNKPDEPTLTIIDNTCTPVVAGTIAATGCGGADEELQWSTDGGTTWSTTAPTYGTTAMTVQVKCVNTSTKCESTVATKATNPTDCGSASSSATIVNYGGPTVADPCTCADDCMFDEEVVVHSNPGETWIVASNKGFLDPALPNDPFPAFTTTLTESSPGVYTLVGKHKDGVGYALAVTNPASGDLLKIGNMCTELPKFDAQLACATIACGDPLPTDLPTASSRCANRTVDVTELTPVELTDYTCTGDGGFFVGGKQINLADVADGGSIMPPPYEIVSGAPFAFTGAADRLTFPLLNGLGFNCDKKTGASLYGLIPDVSKGALPSINNIPRVQLVKLHLSGIDKPEILGTIKEPPELTGTGTPASVVLNYIGDAKDNKFYVAGVSVLYSGNVADLSSLHIEKAVPYFGIIDLNSCEGGAIGEVEPDWKEIKINDVGLTCFDYGLDFIRAMNTFLAAGPDLLTVPSGGIHDWAVSPDGKTLYSFMGITEDGANTDSDDGALVAIDIESGTATCTGGHADNDQYTGMEGAESEEIVGVYFNEAGELMAWQSDMGKLFSIDIPTAKLNLVTDGLPTDYRGDAASCYTCELAEKCEDNISKREYRVFEAKDGCDNKNYQYQFVATEADLTGMDITGLEEEAPLCVNAAAIDLAGVPASADGVFTSNAPAGALTDNGDGTATFDPSVAGIGLWEIGYTDKGSDGCCPIVKHILVAPALPIVFDSQLKCDTIACGTDFPTDLPEMAGGKGTVTVVDTVDVEGYDGLAAKVGGILVGGLHGDYTTPYTIHAADGSFTQLPEPFNETFAFINGIGFNCDTLKGASLYGLLPTFDGVQWSSVYDLLADINDVVENPDGHAGEISALAANPPRVSLVKIHPNGQYPTEVLGIIKEPIKFSVGGEVTVSTVLNYIGDAKDNKFYVSGVSLTYDIGAKRVTAAAPHLGVIDLNGCEAKTGKFIEPDWKEIDLMAGTCNTLGDEFISKVNTYIRTREGSIPSGGIHDWAVNPAGDKLYSFMGIENALVEIDIATGAPTCTRGPVSNETNGYAGVAGHDTDEFGGVYFKGDQLMLWQHDSGTLFSVDLTDGTLTEEETGLPVNYVGDAASCSTCEVVPVDCEDGIVDRKYRVIEGVVDTFGCEVKNYQYQLVVTKDDASVVADLGKDTTVCENDPVVEIKGSPVPSGDDVAVFEISPNASADVFKDDKDGTATFDPKEAGVGTWEVIYSYNKAGACCAKTDTMKITVIASPAVPTVKDIEVCEGGDTKIVPESNSAAPGGGACTATSDLVITGVIDGPLFQGRPKAVEFYVVNDIADLSEYGFGSANAGPSDGQEFDFPADAVTAGTYIWVATEATEFNNFFGFAPTYTHGQAPSINGDDPIELFHNGVVIDVFGVVGVDGTGQAWEYMDGWAYRNSDAGNSTTFNVADWKFSGANALNGATTNATAGTPMPNGTYSCTVAANTAMFNFYSDEALTVLVAGPAESYDPGTTSGNSPEMYWVTEVNATTGCESDAVKVTVTVHRQPEAEVGANEFYCGLPETIDLDVNTNYNGTWIMTGGSGNIEDAAGEHTFYTPVAADINTTIVFVWTTEIPPYGGCESTSDSFAVTIVSETADAEFEYSQTEYCPGSSNPTVSHITGVDGIYTYRVLSNGPNLVLDKHTGEIDFGASDWGTYEVTNTVDGKGNLIITGVIDGTLPGGLPKAIELYAIRDITDLSRYGLESANNGSGINGIEYTFPDTAIAAGTHIWVASEESKFEQYFGFKPTYALVGAANINGDDAILLYNDGQVIDVFGQPDVDGTGEAWEYADSWAYRKSNTGLDGTLFDIDNWKFGGVGSLVGSAMNTDFPIGSFKTTFDEGCASDVHKDTITIGDLEPPVVDCPSDLTVYLDPGDCSAYPYWDGPEITDNCDSNPEVTKVGPNPGDELTLDNSPYLVVYTITDASGNSVECSFNIKLEGYPKPTDVLACNDTVQVSLDMNCEIQMNADMYLEGGPYQCYNLFEVYVNHPDFEGINVSNQIIDLGSGVYTVTVVDAANGDNSCETVIVALDKMPPTIVCDSIVIDCDVSLDTTANPFLTIPAVSDNCSVPELSYRDNELGGDCTTEYINQIERTWIATDPATGMYVTCVQLISVEKAVFDNSKPWLPKNWDDLAGNNPMLLCDEEYPLDANLNPHPKHTGGPLGVGYDAETGKTICGTIEVFYSDVVYGKEDGVPCGQKILRTWTIVDDCTGEVFRGVQIIRITDKTAPSFTLPVEDTILISAGAYECKATYNVLELTDLEDHCDTLPTYRVVVPENPEVVVDGHLLTNIPEGFTMVVYEATDACGNVSRDTFHIEVQDLVPPIAVCEQFKQVSLTVDGRGTVCAEDFDSGSLDNCNDIYFRVSRDNVTFSECVEFGCTDIGESQMVTLRVYDVEIEGGNVGSGAYAGHYNDCMSNVEVLCKLPPVITCQDVVHVPVDCEKLDSLGDLGSYLVAPTVQAVCEPTITHGEIIESGDLCNREYSVLWTVESCGKKQVCNQVIVLETEKRFDPCTIVMPADVQAECKKDLAYAEPTWEASLCDMVTAEIIHEDTFKFVDGACFKILREWAVIDWCVYKQNTGAEEDRDEWTGRVLNCAHDHYKTAAGVDTFDGYYRYTQVLMMIDEVDPEVEVSDTCIGVVDCTAYPVSLTASAVDTCNLTKEYNWKYRILDVESLEVVQYSSQYSIDPSTDDKIGTSDKLRRTNSPVINLNNALPLGEYRVEWTVGDGCGNIGKGIQIVHVVDNKAPTPILVDLSTALMSNCMVEVCARTFDKGGCDNGCLSSLDNCTEKEGLYFTFTPVLPNLSENPQAWASQYTTYGRYFYNPVTGEISTEEEYMFGEALAWNPELQTSCKVYGVDRNGKAPELTQFVDVYVWDTFGENNDCDYNNYDYATAVLVLNDEGDDCPGGASSLVSGMVSSCNNEGSGLGISEVSVTFDDGEGRKTAVSGETGLYSVDLSDSYYDVEASKQTKGLTGLSTMDIVMIQKHILGIDKLKDPCQLAAMDISQDGKVSVLDVLILRKKILGKESDIIDWNFMDESYLETYGYFNLRESYKKRISVANGITSDNMNFVGVMTGDVNMSGVNSLIESRTGGVMSLELDNEVLSAGEQVEVPVYAKDFTDVRGGQFAISLNNLKVESLKGGKLAIDNSNYNVRGNNLLVSWSAVEGQDVSNGDVLFTMLVEATSDVSLSNALSINDSRLRSEAYKGSDLEISTIELSYRNSSYALYQNTPNPFVSETTIGFELPESSEYTLTVYDVTGKLVKVISETGKAGYNTQTISKKELQASGVLYYRLESGDYTSTKKMVILK